MKEKTSINRNGLALYVWLDISDNCIFSLWDACNERGWYDLRRKYLDEKYPKNNRQGLWDKSKVKNELEEMSSSDRKYWIDRWIDNYIETGVLWSEIFEVLIEWLDYSQSEKALSLVARALIHKGSRLDVAALEQYKSLSKAANDVVFDTKYGVYRRTLS